MIKSTHITALFIISLLFAVVSCDLFSGSDSLPGDLDHTLEKTGVDFSYQLLEPFDLSDGEDAHLKGLITIDDFEEGESAKSVSMYLYTLRVASKDLYLNLRDDPVQIYEINLEELEIISRGQLPWSNVPPWGITRIVTIPLTEIVENLPIDLTTDQLSASDRLSIQWKVSLDDGRETTRPCPWGMVYAGLPPPFCSSLYIQYYPPEDAFTGLYRFTQLDSSSVSVSGVFESMPHVFSDMQFEAELSYADGVVREFTERYLNFDHPRNYRMIFDLSESSVSMKPVTPTGLACTTGLFLGPEEEPFSSFDMYDDSEFIMALTDNTEGDCSSPPVQVRFHVEKVE